MRYCYHLVYPLQQNIHTTKNERLSMFSLFMLRGIFERALIFSLLTNAIFLTSRILRFDDLTLEGSFGIGGGVAALLLANQYSVAVAFLGAIAAGISAGVITGLLHTKLQFNQLISGIITTTALFSVTLRIAGAHIALPARTFSLTATIVLIALVALIFTVLYWFLKTEHGFLIKAVGDNPRVVVGLAKSPIRYQLYALAIANGLIALSGALFTYYIGYFSIWSNIGMLIVALASLILAEVFSQSFTPLLFFGAFLYQCIIAVTYSFHINQDWNKLITATIIIVCIITQKLFKEKGP